MPKWEVKYSTTSEPNRDLLPKDAEVSVVSEYPLTVRRGGARLDLHKVPATAGALASDLVASIKVGGRSVHLDATEAAVIAAELNSLVHQRNQGKAKAEADRKAAEDKRRREASARQLGDIFAARRVRLGNPFFPPDPLASQPGMFGL
ncbi:MAG TPA: hypothetical protein VM677_27935 [Actinokineospora sp.]|jgi:hypothetical protein|nr:hypothetical protein [Actinokineospora sp.]